MVNEINITENFAEKLRLGVLSVQEQIALLYGPVSSPGIDTFAKKQRDYQLFEYAIIKALENEMVQHMLVAERLAKAYAIAAERTEAPAKHPELVERKHEQTTNGLNTYLDSLKLLYTNLSDLIKNLDLQLQFIAQQQRHIMDTMVLPALMQLRPTLPVIHRLRNLEGGDVDILVNPHMNNAIDRFANRLQNNPGDIQSEDQFDDVFDQTINALDIQDVASARNGNRIPLDPFEHSDHILSVRDVIRTTFRQNPQYDDTRRAVHRGLHHFEILNLMRQLIEPIKEAAEDTLESAADMIGNIRRLPRPEPVRRFVKAGEDIYQECAEAAKSLGQGLEKVSQQFYDSGLGLHSANPSLSGWPPRLSPRG